MHSCQEIFISLYSYSAFLLCCFWNRVFCIVAKLCIVQTFFHCSRLSLIISIMTFDRCLLGHERLQYVAYVATQKRRRIEGVCGSLTEERLESSPRGVARFFVNCVGGLAPAPPTFPLRSLSAILWCFIIWTIAVFRPLCQKIELIAKAGFWE